MLYAVYTILGRRTSSSSKAMTILSHSSLFNSLLGELSFRKLKAPSADLDRPVWSRAQVRKKKKVLDVAQVP